MTDYNFGDIVLVPFPFTDQSTIKKRPAVVVSSSDYNRQRSDLIITAVTSQMRSASYFGDTAITDWQSAGLLKPSVFKAIFTSIEKRLILKKLGHTKPRPGEATGFIQWTFLELRRCMIEGGPPRHAMHTISLR